MGVVLPAGRVSLPIVGFAPAEGSPVRIAWGFAL